MKKRYLIILILTQLFLSCDKNLINKMESQTVNKFKKTSEYTVAKAIQKDDVKKIESILTKNESIIKKSHEEEFYSLLHLAVELQRVKSVKILLDSGYNSNAKTKTGITPLFLITGFSQIPYGEKSKADQIIKLLLEYGANPDVIFPGYNRNPKRDITTIGLSPLMNSISNSMNYIYNYAFFMDTSDEISQKRKNYNNLDMTKILVEEGNADINIKTDLNITPSVLALYYQEIEKAHYLICDKHADILDEFYFSETDLIDNKKSYPVQILRNMIYPVNSEEYKLKLDIINEFKKQGVDYYLEPIPESVLEIIKGLYPESWQDYIKVY